MEKLHFLELTIYASLFLSGKSSEADYHHAPDGWWYSTSVSIQKNRKNGYIKMGHYYTNDNDPLGEDEVVRLCYRAIRNIYAPHPEDIDLRISLKTALAWQTYQEEQAEPVTDEQIRIMITHLDASIRKIKKDILRNMIKY